MPQEHLVGSIPSQPSPSSQRSASLSHGSQTELVWLAESKTSGRAQLSLHLKDPTESLPTSIPTSHKEDRWVGFHRQPLPSRTDGWLPTVMVMRHRTCREALMTCFLADCLCFWYYGQEGFYFLPNLNTLIHSCPLNVLILDSGLILFLTFFLKH